MCLGPEPSLVNWSTEGEDLLRTEPVQPVTQPAEESGKMSILFAILTCTVCWFTAVRPKEPLERTLTLGLSVDPIPGTALPKQKSFPGSADPAGKFPPYPLPRVQGSRLNAHNINSTIVYYVVALACSQ